MIRTPSWWTFASLALLAVSFAGAGGVRAADDGSVAPATESQTRPGEVVERVQVTAGRLSDAPEEASRIPAQVTVFTREEIEASGAASVQEFLALRSDFVVFDEVGNGIQSTADLRGFNTGSLATSALVTLNGARVNEPDTGYVNFALIPLSDVERIEVIRGSASALFGEGGLGGVLNVVTRTGGDASPVSAAVSYGSYDTQDYRLASGGRHGRFSYYGGFDHRLSEGFRDNTDIRLSSFQFGGDWALSDRQRVGLDFTGGSNHFNQPGALTSAELEADPTQNPFNSHDFSATDHYLPSLHYHLLLPTGFSLTSRLAYRDTAEDAFNGGRSGLGSQSAVDREGLSATVQISEERSFGPRSNLLVAGGELARDRFATGQTRTDAAGTPLPPADLSYSVSNGDSTRRAGGLFVQDTFTFNPRWSVTTGIRYDRIALHSDGDQALYEFPPPTFSPVFTQRATGGDQDFSRWSPRAGFNFNPTPETGFYLGYSQGYRAPTVVELFAFPIFFSNPNLRPVHSDDFEAGWRQSLGPRAEMSLNAFWIDVDDEIFFVLTDPASFTGTNLNLPRTRRRGAVATFQGPLGSRLRGELGATFTDATFRTAFNDASIGNQVEPGDQLPQIPRWKLDAHLELPLPGGWKAHLQDIYVGSQVLSSDLANVAPRLSPYNVLNARVTYTHGRWSAFLQGNNLLDRFYSTRGIYAFDFSTFAFGEFYTPAPGRNFYSGVRVDY